MKDENWPIKRWKLKDMTTSVTDVCTGCHRSGRQIAKRGHSPECVYRKVEAATKPTNPKDAVGVLKYPMSYVSAPVLAEVAVGMAEGGHKYGRHNYRVIGVRGSIYYDATMRHLMQWWEGEDLDPDSGLSHITKAITSLVVLRDAMIQNKFNDDRPPKSQAWAEDLNARTKALDTKYSEKKASYIEGGFFPPKGV